MGRFWAKLRRKRGKFEIPMYDAITGTTLDRFERWDWSIRNIGRFLAAKIGPVLDRVFSSGNSHLGIYLGSILHKIHI